MKTLSLLSLSVFLSIFSFSQSARADLIASSGKSTAELAKRIFSGQLTREVTLVEVETLGGSSAEGAKLWSVFSKLRGAGAALHGTDLPWEDYARLALHTDRDAGKAVQQIQALAERTQTTSASHRLFAAVDSGQPRAADPLRQAGRANNGFGLSLYRNVQKLTAKGNKFLSPTSAYLAMAMAYNGAAEASKAELELALGVQGMERDEVNAANHAMLEALNHGGKDYQLSVANSVWSRQGFAFLPSFATRVRSQYNAEVSVLDFDQPAAAKTINDWCKARTNGRIPTIVGDRLSEELRMILINATYFKADWQHPFEAKHTALRPFQTEAGDVVQVPTMAQTGHFKHQQGTFGEAIELPYGRNGDLRMIVVLPTEGQTLDAFEKSLDAASWESLVQGLDAQPVLQGSLALPKLKLNYEDSLAASLQAMGVRRAFGAGANFSDLSNEAVFISEVLQKTFLEVDEKGTEAAAVTAVMISATSIRMPPPLAFNMRVDRPYFFAIADKRSGAILFGGSVREPEGGVLPKAKKPF